MLMDESSNCMLLRSEPTQPSNAMMQADLEYHKQEPMAVS
jgi:hypothetical protein